jgi:hypothetical protein
VTEAQRSFAPSILERQVTAAADIHDCKVTGINQPQAVEQTWPSNMWLLFSISATTTLRGSRFGGQRLGKQYKFEVLDLVQLM